MGEESVKGANMGVILIIFAAILALGLIIFMLARNMANEGLTNVAERLEVASNSEFTDFDQKIVVGQRVLSAMNSFKGKRIAVLVSTQGLIDKVDKINGAYNPGTAIKTSLMNGNVKGDDGGTRILDATAVLSGHTKAYFAFAAVPGRNASDNSVDRDADKRTARPASSSGRTNDKQRTFIQYTLHSRNIIPCYHKEPAKSQGKIKRKHLKNPKNCGIIIPWIY